MKAAPCHHEGPDRDEEAEERGPERAARGHLHRPPRASSVGEGAQEPGDPEKCEDVDSARSPWREPALPAAHCTRGDPRGTHCDLTNMCSRQLGRCLLQRGPRHPLRPQGGPESPLLPQQSGTRAAPLCDTRVPLSQRPQYPGLGSRDPRPAEPRHRGTLPGRGVLCSWRRVSPDPKLLRRAGGRAPHRVCL